MPTPSPGAPSARSNFRPRADRLQVCRHKRPRRLAYNRTGVRCGRQGDRAPQFRTSICQLADRDDLVGLRSSLRVPFPASRVPLSIFHSTSGGGNLPKRRGGFAMGANDMTFSENPTHRCGMRASHFSDQETMSPLHIRRREYLDWLE